MASSFFALLDDIAVLAKASAASMDDISILAKAAASATDDIVTGAGKAASKTAAVLIDDAAVTPQYLQGISPTRELPVVWRIARGSLVNKAIVIIAIMLLSLWAPWVFPWALILGGAYLAFEGAEKLTHYLHKKREKYKSDKDIAKAVEEVLTRAPADEAAIVRSAVTTDLVLSVEIMLISMSNLESDIWWMQLAMLVAIGLLMTVLVYGSVGLLIKLDDVGLFVAKRGVLRKSSFLQSAGTGLVKFMPFAFKALTIVGTAAMLWVGGHLLLANFAEVGLSAPMDLLQRIVQPIGNSVLFWLADALLSGIFGIAAGLVIVAALAVPAKLKKATVEH